MEDRTCFLGMSRLPVTGRGGGGCGQQRDTPSVTLSPDLDSAAQNQTQPALGTP